MARWKSFVRNRRSSYRSRRFRPAPLGLEERTLLSINDPIGIVADAASNVYVSYVESTFPTNQQDVEEFPANGGQPSNLFFTTGPNALPGPLVLLGSSASLPNLSANDILELQPDGELFAYSLASKQITKYDDFQAYSPGASSVLNLQTGSYINLNGTINLSTAAYGDFAVLGNNLIFSAKSNGWDFVLRDTYSENALGAITVTLKVLVASQVNTGLNGPGGVAVNSQGTVLTTQPSILGGDDAFAFNLLFDQGGVPQPEALKFNSFYLPPVIESLGITTDAAGNFAIAAVSTSLLDNNPGYVTVSANLDQFGAQTTAPLSSNPAPVPWSVTIVTVGNGLRDLIGTIPTGNETLLAPDGYQPPLSEYSPGQIRHAYGVDQITFPGPNGTTVPGNGAGQTIAIVDVGDDPTIFQDLTFFDQTYNLPTPTNISGKSGSPPAFFFDQINEDSDTPEEPETIGETALDVEWAHAIAPDANIVLYDVDPNDGDPLGGLYVGAAAAATEPGLGVSVVSLSYGIAEFVLAANLPNGQTESEFDQNFLTPNVTYFVSSGDQGAYPDDGSGQDPRIGVAYAAASPDVVAVGGTSLQKLDAAGDYPGTSSNGEIGWGNGTNSGPDGGSGGGLSGGNLSSLEDGETEPTWQQGVVPSQIDTTGTRAVPDVSWVSDPATGLSAYTSTFCSDGDFNGWFNVGGTSDAAPQWAGLVAIVNQERAQAYGAAPLTGYNQTLPALYSLPTTDFHNILYGNNGNAVPSGGGYNLVTGLGTPIANLLVPDLASFQVPSQMIVTSQPPGSVPSGSKFALSVTIEDALGNVVTNFNGSVQIALANNPGGSTLGGMLTVTAKNGVATFSDLTLSKPGNGYTLQVSAAGLNSVTTNAFNVVAAAASKLIVATQPQANVTAGSSFGLTIDVEDASGNIVANYSGSVTVAIASNPGSGTLGGTTTVTVVNGVATFNAINLKKAGNGYTLQATSGSLTSVTTRSFNVVAGAAAQLGISTAPPPSVQAGSPFGLTVAIEDTYGNTVSSATGSVSIALSSNPGNGTLNGALTATLVNGVATFSGLTLNALGTGYTIQATSSGLGSVTTSPFNVVAGAAAALVLTSQPGSSVTAGSGFGLSVTVKDAFGNVVSSYNGSVNLAISSNPGGSTLSGTTTVTVANGVASFNGLTLNKAGTGYTLQASSGSLPVVTTNAFNVVAAAAAQLAVTTQPQANVTAGSGFGLSVAVEDAFGNLVSSYNGSISVALASNPGGGSLGGTLTATVSNGGADFSGLTLVKAANGYTIQASSSGLTSVSTSPFNVVAAAASQLAVTAQPPPSVTAGTPFGLSVAIEDAYGNTVLSANGSVSVALSNNPGNGGLSGTLTLAASSGVAKYTGLTLDVAATGYTLQVSSNGLSGATSGSFTVVPAAAAVLVLSSQPGSSVTAGDNFSLSVTVEDAFANVVTGYSGSVAIALSSNPGGGTLGGTSTVTVAGGVASFNGLSLTKAGVGYTLKASSGSLPAVSTNAFSVVAAAAAQLAITTQPQASVTAGSGFGLSVAVVDAFGNQVASYNSGVSITLASNPGGDTLRGTLTATVVSGVAGFSGLMLDLVGTGYRFQVTSGALTPATSNSLTVTPAAAAQLLVSAQPSATATAGRAFGTQPMLSIEDQFGNLETGDNSTTVTAAQSGGVGPLEGSASATVSHGVATFANLSDNKAETITLQFSSGNLKSVTSSAIVVSPAAASQLVIFTQPAANATAGQPFGNQTVIEEDDQYGNLETGDFSTKVVVSINSGSGPLGGTTSATVSGGVATFGNMTDNKAETITLTFNSGILTPATSGPVVVSPAAASQLVVHIPQSATATAGQPFASQPVVEEEDQYGNLEKSDNSTVVTATLNSGAGTLDGTTQVAVSGGVATFTGLNDDIAGPITLQFFSGSLTPATTAQTVVKPAAASQLVVQTQASSTATAGKPFAVQPVIGLEDPYGNVETGDNSAAVTVSISSGGALLGATTAIATSGVASFTGLADDLAEAITLTFTDGNLKAATSLTIVVSPAAASQFVIQTQPSATATAGQVFGTQPSIEEEDQFGNLETGDNHTVVTVSLTGGAGPLQGATSATVAGGVATFTDLADDKAETIGLAFTSGSLAANARQVTIVPASAATLVVTNSPPPSVTAGDAFGFGVTTEDRFGNIVPSFAGSVTVALANNPRGATLNGALTVSVVSGVASFAGLMLDTAAPGYTLEAMSAGLASAVTSPVTVTPASATQLVVTSQPPATVAPESGFALVIAAEDRFGNVVTSESGNVTVSIANGAGGTLAGSSTAPFVDGIANVAGLTLNKAGGYALQISGNGLAAAESTSFTVIPPPTIIREQVLTTGKGKHKKSIGFELFFSAAIDPSRAQNAANYTVTQTVKHGHKISMKPVRLRAVYSPSANAVSLTVIGSAPFTSGGQIIVSASASSGITDASGTALDGNNEGVPGDNAVLSVLPKDRGVVR
jgi:subtilase family serine protease